MGLASKIKDALHGDHHDKATDVRPPGAFPQDDMAQEHSDGKKYVAPHGSLVDKNRTNKLHKEGEDYLLAETGQVTSAHGTRHHKHVDSGIDLGQTSGRGHTKEGAYWGDLTPDGHESKGTHDLDKDLSGRGHRDHSYSPTRTGHNTSSLPDRTANGHGLGHDHPTGSAGRHSPLHGEQAVGGGVYNTASGVGSPDYDRTHGSTKPHASGGAIHDPLTSSTRGTSPPSGASGYGYKTSLAGAGAPTSRSDHITGSAPLGTGERGLGQGGLSQGGLSHGGVSGGGLNGGGLSGSGLGGQGLAGSGVGRSPGAGHGNSHAGADLAGAGVGAAAGYGADELAHRGQGSTGHGDAYGSATSSHHTPGVPHSSMLDVEQPGGVAASHPNHMNQSPGIPHDTSLGSDRGISGSANHHGSPGIGSGSPTNVASGIGSQVGRSSPASSGPANGHYGPGHPGAKVLHQCSHCGRDNDISQYFKQDVVYRLGQ